MASKMNMGESSKSSKVSKDRRVSKHVYKLTSQALGQGGDLTKDQTKGMACAVKLFDSPCLVTSSDVDCKNPFIMDRYSRRHSGETDYQLHNSSIINCLTFDSFSFLLLNKDISRRKQCIFELPLKVPSRDGTFHVHEFGKSCTLDPKQRELDTDYPLGSPIVQTTVTGSGTNQAVVGVVGRDKGKLCRFFINNEILDQLKDVSGPHVEDQDEKKEAVSTETQSKRQTFASGKTGEQSNMQGDRDTTDAIPEKKPEEKANGGGGPPKKHPTMHPGGKPNDGEDPADEQPVMQPEPGREKRGDHDTDEVDQGKTSIEETGKADKIPGALRPRNIASGKEGASSRLSTSVLAISHSVCRKVCIKLNNKDEIFFRDFRMLGEKLGFNKTVIHGLGNETTANPTDKLLLAWSAADDNEATVKKLIELLKEKDLERMDVVNVLENWLKQDPYSKLSSKVSDIPLETYSTICLMLNVQRPLYNDYRILGEKLKFSRVEIKGFEQGKTDPTHTLIEKWCESEGNAATVARLIELMKDMKRMDVVEILEDWVNTGLAAELRGTFN